MPLTMADKQAVVAEVAEVASRAHSAVAAEYRGLSVAEMTVLREKARESGVYLRVVRNTLARRAVADTQFACLQKELIGPLVLAFSETDPGASARVIRDFSKGNNKLVVKLVSFGGRLLGVDEIDFLANLPTHEQAIARLMMIIKAPITQLVRTLSEPHSKLVRTIDAVRRQKEMGS